MINSTVESCCFLGVIGELEFRPPIRKLPTVFEAGAGWVIIGYINTSTCREMYEAMKQYPILFQSKVRHNRNSGRQCFFVIYDVSSAPEGYGYMAYDKASYQSRLGVY